MTGREKARGRPARVETTVAGRHRSPTAGFALVEALATVVIVGMLSIMLVEGVTLGRRVWERMDTRMAAVEAVDGAQTVLRDRLDKMYAATLYGGEEILIDMDGQPEQLDFLAAPPVSQSPSPLRRYQVELTAGQDLILTSTSDIAIAGQGGATRQVLLTGVRSLDIAYYGVAAPDNTARWRPSWSSQSLTPQLIRIRADFEPGDPRIWPDLVVHPRVNIDSGCILSTSTAHCRGR